jgi:hypothetical protein
MKDDKCDLCALKVIFDQTALSKERNIENFFGTLRRLQKNKIIEKGYERRIFIDNGSGNKSEMCAVNSKFFLKKNKDKKCPEFVLNMDLSVPDALSLNLSKKNVKLASKIKWLTWALVFLTLALLSIGITKVRQNAVIPELESDKKAKYTQTHNRANPTKQIPKSLVPIQSVPKNEPPQKGTNEVHK